MDTSLDRHTFLLTTGAIGTISTVACFGFSGDELTRQDDSDTVAVVSQHERTMEAGLELLENGGTAVDAVACTLSAVEPWFSSALGGDTWALYYDAESDAVTSVDGVGPVGYNPTPSDFEERADSSGMHQAVAPWDG